MPVWWQNQKVMFTEELPSGMEQSGDPSKTIVLIQNNFLDRKDRVVEHLCCQWQECLGN